MLIGETITKGLGTDTQYEIGEKAAEENIEQFKTLLKEVDVLFLVCGLGGGAGSGAVPVVARIARQMGILTIPIAIWPFKFESHKRHRNAIYSIAQLKKDADTIFLVSNDVFLEHIDRRMTMPDALKMMDRVIWAAIEGIIDSIRSDCLKNVTLSDLKTIMQEKQVAHIGIAKGKEKIREALDQAVNYLFMENTCDKASKAFIHLSGDITLSDVDDATNFIQEKLNVPNIVSTARQNEDKHEEVSIVIIVFETDIENKIAENRDKVRGRDEKSNCVKEGGDNLITDVPDRDVSKTETSNFIIENGILKQYLGDAKEVIIPEGVTAIEGHDRYDKDKMAIKLYPIEGAFEGCGSLERIILPNSVERIGERAFAHCHRLEEINLPESLTEVGNHAFQECVNLKGIILPDGVKRIGHGAFKLCLELKEINLPRSLKEVGDSAFLGCKSLESVIFSKGVLEIEDRVLVYGVERIGNSTFSGCICLKKINLPACLKEVGDSAFSKCKKLTDIILPNGVKIIGKHAFGGCSSLEKINLPRSLKEVGERAFANCDNLREVEIPKLTIVRKEAFPRTVKQKKKWMFY